MRVLHVFKTYWPETFGGVERAIDAIIKHSQSCGVEGAVLTLAEPGTSLPDRKDGYPILRARRTLDLFSTGLSVDAIPLFRKAAAEADIVNYHFPWPFMDVMHFAARHGKPSVVTYHSDIVKQKTLLHLYRPLMQKFLAEADAIVATSPNYRDTSPVLSAHADKVRIVPLGLSEADYPVPTPDLVGHWRKRFPRPFALFSGVFRYYKGLDSLVDAAAKVGFDIVLIGDGPEKSRLEALARRRNLTNLHFLGYVDDADKMALLGLARLFVLPSHQRSEAYGLSLVEAAMSGLPMVSCEIGSGMSFINIDGKTGFGVPPSNPDALAAAMQKLVDNPDMAQTMGQAARARFEAELTAETMGARYAEIYRSLI